mmetsp:Transcript_105454/g.304475  ORF Transcript_105454/g.304475 Transcript_105454/m.304475 type:complete len:321 (+) Transcript_105454:4087-5049(+)
MTRPPPPHAPVARPRAPEHHGHPRHMTIAASLAANSASPDVSGRSGSEPPASTTLPLARSFFRQHFLYLIPDPHGQSPPRRGLAFAPGGGESEPFFLPFLAPPLSLSFKLSFLRIEAGSNGSQPSSVCMQGWGGGVVEHHACGGDRAEWGSYAPLTVVAAAPLVSAAPSFAPPFSGPPAAVLTPSGVCASPLAAASSAGAPSSLPPLPPLPPPSPPPPTPPSPASSCASVCESPGSPTYPSMSSSIAASASAPTSRSTERICSRVASGQLSATNFSSSDSSGSSAVPNTPPPAAPPLGVRSMMGTGGTIVLKSSAWRTEL